MKRNKKWIDRTITLFFVMLFMYSAYDLVTYYVDQARNEEVMEEAQIMYKQSVSAAAAEQQQRNRYEPLLAINSDIVGWIRIHGTNIDYPVLQAEDNHYYLRRNYKHENNIAGSIFMDYRNALDGKDRNIIVYGHRMKNGSMFADLELFLDENFFRSDREILFETLDEQYEVEIFSVYQTTTEFNYIRTSFSDGEDYVNFLESLKQRSIHQPDVELTEETAILTLSTCDYQLDRDRGRLVVHGILKKK